MERGKEIVKVSIYGIVVNLVLVGFKMLVGVIANSISVILDAVNNLTDVLSSVVTIVGAKLSGRRPDREHPYGHGRLEYFSAMVVALIVLAAGVMALKESVEKIITPEEADYSVATLVVIVAAVAVKFVFGRYVKKKGEKLNSGSLTASGVDALSDAALSLSVLVGAVVSMIWDVNIDGYIGVVIAAMIIKTAIEIMRDAVLDLIGRRVDSELVARVKNTMMKQPEVQGVYDLALHDYGPNKVIGSAHIQVSDELRTREIHRLSRRIEMKVYEKYGIIMTLGVYAENKSGELKVMKNAVERILDDYPTLLQMHGFYVDEEYKVVSFDLIFDFAEVEAEAKCKEIRRRVKKMYPEYKVYVIMDTDVSGEYDKKVS